MQTIRNYELMVGQSVTAGNTITSDRLDITNSRGYAIVIEVSGAALTGSCKMQASFDGTNWADDGASQSISGTGGIFLFNKDGAHYPLVRASISSTAGTMTVSVKGMAKAGG